MLFESNSSRGIFASLKNNTRVLMSKQRKSRKHHVKDRELPKPISKDMTIVVQKIYSAAVGKEIQFSVPTSEPTIHDQDPTLLTVHTSYRYEAEPWLRGDPKNGKKFAKELESIHVTFPTIIDQATILSMAAWFSVLCKIDDLTEKMEPTAARAILQDVKNMTRRDSGVEFIDDTELNVEDPSPEAKVRTIMKAFSMHTHNLLPASVFMSFMEDIANVIAWMTAETIFRESPPPSVESYMKIRRGTIAIAPFFTLAESSLNNFSTLPAHSPDLEEMKELLNDIVGLQNDLIGLDKDIEEGWPMNIVVVLGGLRLILPDSPQEEAQVRRECVSEAETMHEVAVKKAIEKWKAIHHGSKNECEKELSDVMIVFVEQFLKWSMACQRYKSGH